MFRILGMVRHGGGSLVGLVTPSVTHGGRRSRRAIFLENQLILGHPLPSPRTALACRAMPKLDATAIVVAYHFVRAVGSRRFNLRAHETPDRFREQVRQISDRFTVCSTDELVDLRDDLDRRQVAIHFDDGAADVAREALPILMEHGVTATVFICSRPYLDGRLLDVQKIEYLVQRLGLKRFQSAFSIELARQFPAGVVRESLDFADGYQFYRYDKREMREFKLDLNYRIPYSNVDPVLDVLFDGIFGADAEAEAVRETYLSRDDLKKIVDAGVEIGVHTHNHRVLPRLDLDSQRSEIAIGLEFVKQLTGVSDPSVAYPFGFSDKRTEIAISESGAAAGFSIGRRGITAADLKSRWTIPRFDVNDCFDRNTNAIITDVFDPVTDFSKGSPQLSTGK